MKSAISSIFLKPNIIDIGTNINGVMTSLPRDMITSSFLYLFNDSNEIIVPIHIIPIGVEQLPITIKGDKICFGILILKYTKTNPKIPDSIILFEKIFFKIILILTFFSLKISKSITDIKLKKGTINAAKYL